METAVASTPSAKRKQSWAIEQSQFEASGLTVREFCLLHNLGISTFYKRRAALRALAHQDTRIHRLSKAESLTSTNVVGDIGDIGFIEAGVLETRQSVSQSLEALADRPTPQSAPTAPVDLRDESTGLELRLELGFGVVLTIVRR